MRGVRGRLQVPVISNASDALDKIRFLSLTCVSGAFQEGGGGCTRVCFLGVGQCVDTVSNASDALDQIRFLSLTCMYCADSPRFQRQGCGSIFGKRRGGNACILSVMPTMHSTA